MAEILPFDHVGLTTEQVQPDEDWIEQSRVWVTNPRRHPESIEFLRYESDSQVPEVVRRNPHVAYRVTDLEPHLAGQHVAIPPFVVGGFVRVAFIVKHGMVFEYMQYLDEGRWFSRSSGKA